MKKRNDLERLYLLVITLPKGKKEIIGDMLSQFDVTAYQTTLARGSKDKQMTKEVMFAIIKKETVKDAIFKIEDKFATFNSKISMIYAIPLHSIIGASSYMALFNGGKE